jgi:hypothetical protein
VAKVTIIQGGHLVWHSRKTTNGNKDHRVAQADRGARRADLRHLRNQAEDRRAAAARAVDRVEDRVAGPEVDQAEGRVADLAVGPAAVRAAAQSLVRYAI